MDGRKIRLDFQHCKRQNLSLPLTYTSMSEESLILVNAKEKVCFTCLCISSYFFITTSGW